MSLPSHIVPLSLLCAAVTFGVTFIKMYLDTSEPVGSALAAVLCASLVFIATVTLFWIWKTFTK